MAHIESYPQMVIQWDWEKKPKQGKGTGKRNHKYVPELGKVEILHNYVSFTIDSPHRLGRAIWALQSEQTLISST